MRSEWRLDVRAWLLWAVAAIVPLLTGRNPFMVVEVLIIVAVVRGAWKPAATARLMSWGGILRLAVFFVAVGVLFNVLTVHAGDVVLVRLPEELPLVGGPITQNALVYGVLGGAALVALVMIGTTVGAMLDWQALMRVLPDRMAPLAVAGSVAWAFLPGTTAAWREIQEAQAARGHRSRGPRDLPPLLVPLLDGGLERALTMAEALEARGFGGDTLPSHSEAIHGQQRRSTTARDGWRPRSMDWRSVIFVAGLSFAALAAYAFVVGSGRLAIAAAAVAVPGIAAAVMDRRTFQSRRTRYRIRRWTMMDTLVALSAGAAVTTTLVRSWTVPAGLRFEPYPTLSWPVVDLPLLVGLALLLAPAFAAPVIAEQTP